MPSRIIVIGARGSTLSIKQACEVISSLKRVFTDLDFQLKTITTRGDLIKSSLPQEKGIFVKEIEEALLKQDIDIAVHSLKDLPTSLPKRLLLAAVTKREDPHDAFISKNGKRLLEIESGAVIGTSSLRRKAQTLCLRKDLNLVDSRGNFDTRIKKLKQKEMDGIICAFSALKRLGIRNIKFEKLPFKHFLPCPGQGALGIEVRQDDKFIRNIVSRINHLSTYISTEVERYFLKFLGAGCRTPLGALAVIKNGVIKLQGFVSLPDASFVIRLKMSSSFKNAKNLGERLALEAVKKGALRILEKCN